MPRRHEDHQPIYLATLNGLQLFRNTLVMPGRDIDRVRILSEREKPTPRQLLPKRLQFRDRGKEQLPL